MPQTLWIKGIYPLAKICVYSVLMLHITFSITRILELCLLSRIKIRTHCDCEQLVILDPPPQEVCLHPFRQEHIQFPTVCAHFTTLLWWPDEATLSVTECDAQVTFTFTFTFTLFSTDSLTGDISCSSTETRCKGQRVLLSSNDCTVSSVQHNVYNIHSHTTCFGP